MPDQVGDLPVPGTSGVSEVKPADILYSYAHLTQKGVTMAKVSSGALIAAGTAIGIITASKKAIPYVGGASDGSEICIGFLRQAVDTTDGEKLGNVVMGGVVRYSLLTGVDAGAIEDLQGHRNIPFDFLDF
jgi:hypothetical protein